MKRLKRPDSDALPAPKKRSKYVCSVCDDRKFNRPVKLFQHMEKCHCEILDGLKCPFSLCGRIAKSKEELSRHMLNMHGVKRPVNVVKCPQTGCEKLTFSCLSELWRHDETVHKSVHDASYLFKGAKEKPAPPALPMYVRTSVPTRGFWFEHFQQKRFNGDDKDEDLFSDCDKHYRCPLPGTEVDIKNGNG